MPRTIAAPAAPTLPNLIKWDADSYENLFSMGFLTHGKYELLDGNIVEKMAIKFRHAAIVTRLILYFNGFCPDGALASAFTVAVNVRSMPEPDFAVLTTENPTLTERGYVRPEEVRLAVEVGDSTVDSDISTKAGIYAGAGIAEYWVIDVTGRRIVVHTAPARTGGTNDAAAGGYTNIVEYSDAETIAPTFALTQTTPVSALLP